MTSTTMKFIGDGKWKCSCGTEYSGYITYCRDGCGKENRTDGKGKLILKKQPMIDTTIQKHISRIRKIRNVSVERLAKSIKKSQASLYKFMAGNSSTTIETTEKILQFFHNEFGDETTITLGAKVEIETRNFKGEIL